MLVADSMRSGGHLIGINCQGLHQGAIITMCVGAICLSSLPHVLSSPSPKRHRDSGENEWRGERQTSLDIGINARLAASSQRET